MWCFAWASFMHDSPPSTLPQATLQNLCGDVCQGLHVAPPQATNKVHFDWELFSVLDPLIDWSMLCFTVVDIERPVAVFRPADVSVAGLADGAAKLWWNAPASRKRKAAIVDGKHDDFELSDHEDSDEGGDSDDPGCDDLGGESEHDVEDPPLA